MRSGVALLLALLANAGAADPVQPVLLPQAELVRRLDPAQEWLLLPISEWRQLTAAAAAQAAPAARVGAGLTSGRILIRCDERACTANAALEATVDAGTAAAIPFFAIAPQRLDDLSVGGAPGLLVPGGVPTLLLPGAGSWPIVARWSQAAPATAAAGWTATLPLPLAAALAVEVEAPAGWEVRGDGLTPAGEGCWRLSGAQRSLTLTIQPIGSQAPAWGATQQLRVALAAADTGGTFTWRLGQAEGSMPKPARLRLPTGFIATRPSADIQADGSVALHAERRAEISGLVAPGAAIDLPRLEGASWHGGVVEVAIAEPARLPTPAGWIPIVAPSPTGAAGHRFFAVAHAGTPLTPLALAAAQGLDLRAAAAIAVGAGTLRATWALAISAGIPLHRIAATIPAGWRIVAADAGTGALDLPAGDEVQATAWPLVVDLPQALPVGTTRTLVITLERPASERVEVLPPLITGAVRTSHRVLICADPASEVSLLAAEGPAWRLGPQATSTATSILEPVAELLATDVVPPLILAIHPRPARLEAEAACWLLPRGEDTLVRLDLRLSVAGGALTTVGIELPATAGDGWRIESGEAVLAAAQLVWPAAWTGERLVRLSGRLAATAGRTPAIRPLLSVEGRPAPLRLAVAVLAGERVDAVAAPVGRSLEPDELPAWSAPPPGTRVLAAWRPAAVGETGTVTAHTPRLHEGPAGFLDAVRVRTQVGPGGATTLLSARLAAPGLAALPLRLPAGTTLEQATVDGEPAAVRRDADGRLAVVLPGRTQVQLTLRLAQPTAPGSLAIDLPAIDLPWLTTTWTVAVAPAWRASPLAAAGAMPLDLLDRLPSRRFLGAWQPGATVRDGADPVPDLPVASVADPRLLNGASVLPPPVRPTEGPTLPLIGPRLGGTRIGAPAGLRLAVIPVDDLNRNDRLGRLLGLLGAAGLAALAMRGRIAAWRLVLVSVAAGLATAGLLLSQTPAGVTLGIGEALAVLVPAAALLAWWKRRTAEPETTR